MTARRLSGLLASILCLVATGATAGTLTAATWSQTVFGVSLDRTGSQLGITGSSTATSISVSLVYPPFSTHFFVPKTANGVLDLAISITQGGPQALTATPGMGGATIGVPGTLIGRTAVHNSKGVNQSTFMVGINTLAKLPLSVGVAGQATRTFIISGVKHFQTVDFYAWTPGTLSFASLTSKGAALPSVVAMGSFNLTALGGGTVTLVSPSKISVVCSLAQRRNASFVTLTMNFVPEPSTLLLLGAGALGLVLVGRRKG